MDSACTLRPSRFGIGDPGIDVRSGLLDVGFVTWGPELGILNSGKRTTIGLAGLVSRT